MSTMDNPPTGTTTAVTPSRRSRRLGAIITTLLVTLAVVGVGGIVGSNWYFTSHTLPNTVVAGTKVGVANAAELERSISAQTADLKATVIAGDQQVSVPLASLGVKVDAKATAQHAISSASQSTGVTRLEVWNEVNVPLVSTFDKATLQSFVDNTFGALVKMPTNATLTLDPATTQFVAGTSTTGTNIDTKQAERLLHDYVNATTPPPIDLKLTTVEADFTSGEAQAAAKDLNARIALPITVSAGDKKVTADPATVASWIHAAFDEKSQAVTTTYDTEAITKWVTDEVAPGLEVKQVNQLVWTSPTTKKEKIAQKGVDGSTYDATQTATLTATIAEQLKAGQAAPIEATMKPSKFTVKATNLDPDRYVEIDLTTQKVLLHSDDRVIHTYDTVSGKEGWETPTGTYKVYYKTTIQTMEGGSKEDGTYYKTPNVRWATYFNGGIATHGAYWRTEYGTQVDTAKDGSHGCLNLPEDQAKIVYDFAPIGTKVVVHK
ncbi:L,D-transpeptidase family protein [Micrococcales bacterium 31B]|nr:L,D-transpeptidase family protein [Micrococcales bacterium 31B]